MTEFTLFRHTPGIDPALHIWGWEIPVYLFLGGLVAGLMILAGARLLIMRPHERQAMVCCTIGPLAGLALLSLGMLALFLDLSHKLYVWRLYLTFEPTSPMSWGSWILLLVYPALLANALTHLPETIPALAKRAPMLVTISDYILARPRLVVAIGLANITLGIALGIYTGILLGTLGARPLWSSAVLGPLFLFSGLSTPPRSCTASSCSPRRTPNAPSLPISCSPCWPAGRRHARSTPVSLPPWPRPTTAF